MINNSIGSLAIGNVENKFKNKLGTLGAEKLVQLLNHTKILWLLDVRNMGVDDYNLTTISQGLQANRSLLSLNLSRNDITQTSMKAFCQALSGTMITDLDLS